MASEYKPPPTYKPTKMCLKVSISPGLLFGILRYSFSQWTLLWFPFIGLREYALCTFFINCSLQRYDAIHKNCFGSLWMQKSDFSSGSFRYTPQKFFGVCFNFYLIPKIRFRFSIEFFLVFHSLSSNGWNELILKYILE